MADNNLPTGPWRGYFTDPRAPGRHQMELLLEFGNGRITGEGRDVVGPFVIDGRYGDQVRFTKSYVARHDVFYRGRANGRAIAGGWETGGLRGGFKIWPQGSGTDDDDAETAEEPVEAVGRLDEAIPIGVTLSDTIHWRHHRRLQS